MEERWVLLVLTESIAYDCKFARVNLEICQAPASESGPLAISRHGGTGFIYFLTQNQNLSP